MVQTVKTLCDSCIWKRTNNSNGCFYRTDHVAKRWKPVDTWEGGVFALDICSHHQTDSAYTEQNRKEKVDKHQPRVYTSGMMKRDQQKTLRLIWIAIYISAGIFIGLTWSNYRSLEPVTKGPSYSFEDLMEDDRTLEQIVEGERAQVPVNSDWGVEEAHKALLEREATR